jgi:hypothetical protein
MGSFEPKPLELAVLLGWTVIGAVRDRLSRLEAKLRPRRATGSATCVASPPINMFVRPSAPSRHAQHQLN